MGCNEFSCGTGSGVITFPSDPSNNSVLSAVGVFGGIEVSWTYPSTNPNAVAYVVLYRGITNVFSSAIELAKVAGTYYFDRIDEKSLVRTYYYWIQLVSVNGTEMEVIGPASATPRLSIEKTIEDLTGKIDAGVLANALRTEIGKIGSLQTTMSQEVIDRLRAEGILGDALAQVQTSVGEVTTLLQHEVIERKDAHGAIVAQVDVLAAGADANAAAITELSAVIVDSTTSLASQITTLETKSATDLEAAIQNEQLARTAADNSLAAQINTVQSAAANNLASVQTTMQTNINTLDGKVTRIGALYTAKVDVNGLIGGFGVYNDGNQVEAGFDVDRFWIGRTTNKRKPFIIDNGVVYIDEGAINKLTFSKLRDESGGFIVSGGKVKADYIDADNLHVKGQVSVGAFDGYAWPTAGLGGAHLSDSGFLIGNANGGGKYFQIVSGYGTGGNAAIYTNIPAYIEDLQVDTIKIKNNAITTPLYAESATTSGAQTISGDFQVGAVILIIKVRTSMTSGDVYVKCNGNTILTIPTNESREAEGQTVRWVDEVFTFKHTPGTTAYYSLHTYNPNMFLFSQIIALGCKK